MTLRIAGYDDTLRYTLPVEMTNRGGRVLAVEICCKSFLLKWYTYRILSHASWFPEFGTP